MSSPGRLDLDFEKRVLLCVAAHGIFIRRLFHDHARSPVEWTPCDWNRHVPVAMIIFLCCCPAIVQNATKLDTFHSSGILDPPHQYVRYAGVLSRCWPLKIGLRLILGLWYVDKAGSRECTSGQLNGSRVLVIRCFGVLVIRRFGVVLSPAKQQPLDRGEVHLRL
jgi:hypothetical protein